RLLQPMGRGIQRWVHDLNELYRAEASLHELDFDPKGFEWVDANDVQNSIVSFLRKDAQGRPVLAVFNFTPVPHHHYRVGAPHGGHWRELVNSDASIYGGSGLGNHGGRDADAVPVHGRPFSLNLTLPPLGALFLKGV